MLLLPTHKRLGHAGVVNHYIKFTDTVPPQKKTHTHLPLQKCIQRGIHRNKDNLFMKNIAVFSGEKSLENGPLAEK